MLDKIKQFFHQAAPNESETDTQTQIRLATAALLIEIAIIDHKIDVTELKSMEQILQSTLSLSKDDTEKLIQLAREARDEATSVYEFTQHINDNFNHDQKFQLVQEMWQVAFADGNLDKYEEYMIRKICDLIHVSHSEYIRAKLSIKNQT